MMKKVGVKFQVKFGALLFLAAALAFAACGKGSGSDDFLLSLLVLAGRGTGVTVPAAPGAATVTPGVGRLSLSWAAVTGTTTYQVWCSATNDSASATQYGGDITGTSDVIMGLAKGSICYVWLKAKNSMGTSGFGPMASGTPEWAAGDHVTYTADSMFFDLAYVPGLTFPAGVDDNGDIDGDGGQDMSPAASVTHAYWIGATEVAYELWDTVYDWAIDTTVDHDGDGYTNAVHGDDDVYTFANAGIMTAYPDRPVRSINWRDCLVWCNALTQWYNAKNGTSNYCVYYTSGGLIIRSVSNADIDVPTIYIDANAPGFRLLTSNEWELAARYINDTNDDGDITDTGEYYPGNHVSGDSTSYCYPADGGASTVFSDYAVNNRADANDVGSTTDSALGLYDMSGNVWEWCFDLYATGSNRVQRGGSYAGNFPEFLRLGLVSSSTPGNASASTGFRIARTR